MTPAGKILESYRHLFTSPHGDVVLRDLIDAYVISQRPDHVEPLYWDGKRSLVIEILTNALTPDHKTLKIIEALKED